MDRSRERDGARTWKQRERHREGARKTEREKEREREREREREINEGVYTSVVGREEHRWSISGKKIAREGEATPEINETRGRLDEIDACGTFSRGVGAPHFTVSREEILVSAALYTT